VIDQEVLKLQRDLDRANERLEYYEQLSDQTQHLLNTRIAELESARAELQESETRFRQLTEATFEALFVVDAGRIIDANGVAVGLYRYTRDNLLSLRLVDLVEEVTREQVAEYLSDPGSEPVEIRHRRADGSLFHAELRSGTIAWRGSVAQVVAVRDISERKAMELELQRLARTDYLTGINNRRSFMELARHEFQRSRRYRQPLCVLMLDIDVFKQINDSWGHQAGDETLRCLAKTCVSTFRETDLFGRIGGEEFAIALPMTGVAGARVIAEELRERLSEVRVTVGDRSLSFTVSIGVTELSEGDSGIDDLLGRADKALYAAKKRGRNCVATA